MFVEERSEWPVSLATQNAILKTAQTPRAATRTAPPAACKEKRGYQARSDWNDDEATRSIFIFCMVLARRHGMSAKCIVANQTILSFIYQTTYNARTTSSHGSHGCKQARWVGQGAILRLLGHGMGILAALILYRYLSLVGLCAVLGRMRGRELSVPLKSSDPVGSVVRLQCASSRTRC